MIPLAQTMAALALAGGIYFLCLRKTFDFVSIAFFGQLIYFSPGFYGYVANPYYPGILPVVPIIDDSYLVWITCLSGTLLTGLVYRPSCEACPPLHTSAKFDAALLALMAVSAAVALATNGDAIFSPEKQEVLDSIDRLFLLFASSCQVAMIAFALQRKWLLAMAPALGLVFLLYVGFRAEFALSVIAILAFIARRNGIFVFLKPRFLLPTLLAAAVLLGYKPFLTAYRLGNWRVLDSLQMGSNLWDTLVLQFEPFLTQSVLNETLARHFQIPASTLVDATVASVPFLAPAIGLRPEDVTFNFQDYLFPNISYGMTGSPQAQFMAAIGWAGLILFVVVQNALLVLASKGLQTTSASRKLFVLGAGAFLAFYIQRNDLANSLTLINRVLITVFLAWLGSWILAAGNSGTESQAKWSSN